MMNLTFGRFKRNPEVIKKALVIKNNMTMTTKKLRVFFPVRYLKKNLAVIKNTAKVVSIYMLVDEDDNYAIINAPNIQELMFFETDDVTLDNIQYKVLMFEENQTFIPNNNILQLDQFMYNLYDEFFVKGNVPMFMSYNDVYKIFLESKKYANSRVGESRVAYELLTSLVSRASTDKDIFIRHTKDPSNREVEFVGLSDIFYSYSSTGSKLIGGYFKYGVVNAIVKQEKTSSGTTKVLMR